jgi:hypothetical protein
MKAVEPVKTEEKSPTHTYVAIVHVNKKVRFRFYTEEWKFLQFKRQAAQTGFKRAFFKTEYGSDVEKEALADAMALKDRGIASEVLIDMK